MFLCFLSRFTFECVTLNVGQQDTKLKKKKRENQRLQLLKINNDLKEFF